MATILEQLAELRQSGKKTFAVLVDPDKLKADQVQEFAKQVNEANAGFVLVGGSLLMGSETDSLVQSLKACLQMPLLLFPGNPMQLTPHADAVLFLSLISGRNPEFLIGHHVMAAPYLKKMGIETIPTGYLLVDTGKRTTVHYLSNTEPIPSDKAEIAAATALAGQYLGLKLMYLEGGSGASSPVPKEMISAVSRSTSLPLVVGGGIRSIAQAKDAFEGGADVVVVGNALEQTDRLAFLTELSRLVSQL
jgi:putative glycerol-1-phosphate prenyltransferase